MSCETKANPKNSILFTWQHSAASKRQQLQHCKVIHQGSELLPFSGQTASHDSSRDAGIPPPPLADSTHPPDRLHCLCAFWRWLMAKKNKANKKKKSQGQQISTRNLGDSLLEFPWGTGTAWQAWNPRSSRFRYTRQERKAWSCGGLSALYTQQLPEDQHLARRASLHKIKLLDGISGCYYSWLSPSSTYNFVQVH